MKPVPEPRQTQRIDRLLWMLRLSQTRGAAQNLVAEGHLRVNGRRIVRCAQQIGVGDIVTMPHGMAARVIEVLMLPNRRSGSDEARQHYREIESGSQQARTA
ncbi:S4 domain-containing protein [Croceicoccus ponticola]|uniref:S4 domain-containing protein n=1 Tax=Croceicoccus ponticola TaxID=2217664 RepID=UPI00196B6AF5|nr:S4 domain-containing protein [Croceicoccus ponticola]